MAQNDRPYRLHDFPPKRSTTFAWSLSVSASNASAVIVMPGFSEQEPRRVRFPNTIGNAATVANAIDAAVFETFLPGDEEPLDADADVDFLVNRFGDDSACRTRHGHDFNSVRQPGPSW